MNGLFYKELKRLNQSITNISVDVLKVHPRNTEFFDDISGEEYERFKKSIQNDGLLSPILVSPDMTVISGHQRLKACKDLEIKIVSVMIREDLTDEDEKLKILLAANFGRTKNDESKQRKVAVEYVNLCGRKLGDNQWVSDNHKPTLTQEQIAAQLGVSVATLNEMLSIERKLTPEIKELIDNGSITKTTASKVLTKLSPVEQKELITMYGKDIIEGATQKQVKEYINKLKEKDNIIAGYEMKINAAKAPPTDIGDLLEEKEKLEVEKRKWYEKAQSFKKEAAESKKKLEQAQSASPKETIVEVEVAKIPADYEKIKRELAEAKREITKSRVIIKNIPPNPNIATSFRAKDLTKILEHFSNSISAFQFADDALGECDPHESEKIQELIEVAKKEFDTISSKLKGRTS